MPRKTNAMALRDTYFPGVPLEDFKGSLYAYTQKMSPRWEADPGLLEEKSMKIRRWLTNSVRWRQ
jgi:hypothetical protein